MTGSLNGRLSRLERHVPGGCPVCRHWGPVAWAIGREDAHPTRPETCPSCGRHVPIEELRRVVLARVSFEDV